MPIVCFLLKQLKTKLENVKGYDLKQALHSAQEGAAKETLFYAHKKLCAQKHEYKIVSLLLKQNVFNVTSEILTTKNYSLLKLNIFTLRDCFRFVLKLVKN